MGLWFEHRDESGKLIDRVRFIDGHATLESLHEFVGFAPDGEERWKPFIVSIKDSVALARTSNYLPLEKREWVLRIGFDEG
jgi:hypothetical protein